MWKRLTAAWLALLLAAPAMAQTPYRNADEVLAQSRPEEWRPLDPAHTLVMTLQSGAEIVIELAPAFAPNTIANIEKLVRGRFYDGLWILRAQDNYVVQWGVPDEGDPGAPPPGSVTRTKIAPEFTRALAGLAVTPLPDGDVYAPQVGFAHGMPIGHDQSRAWLTHCYGMVGVGRDDDPASGDGSSLYAVIGHAPRQLDRDITLVGRVVAGMEHLSIMKRGSGEMGFYAGADARPPIVSVRLASELPKDAAARKLEALRTDSASFAALVESRRNRRGSWNTFQSGKIEVCNATLPVRAGK